MTQLFRLVALVGGGSISVDLFPYECPICHHKIEPLPKLSLRTERHVSQAAQFAVDIFFQCPNLSCLMTFIGRYEGTDGDPRDHKPRSLALLTQIEPIRAAPYDVPEEVSKLSPMFVEIAGQASAAESHGLDQVAGVGYRKAVEFLIKDYCMSRHPSAADGIRKAQLAACINNYVGDQNIKRCAQRATWLGNDETHYERRWLDKDIGDLKNLIRLTVNWIANEEMSKQYFDDMPPTAV
jgi:hypothetical protein